MAAGGAGLITAFAAPWLITYCIFFYQRPDPAHCWITEGELTAHAVAQGNENE
mgnify:CR=1 FL=1